MHYYFAQFYPEEDGGYSVFFPDLPGCATCGNDLPESMAMAMDALTGRIEADLEDGDELPPPSDFETARTKAEAYNRELAMPLRNDALYLLVPADPRLEPFVRLKISMQPRLLARIDRKAKSEGMTRSGFLAAAAHNYINQLETQ